MKITYPFTIAMVSVVIYMSNNVLLAKDMNPRDHSKQYKKVIILDRGVRRTLLIENPEVSQVSKQIKLRSYSEKIHTSTFGLILRMKKHTKLNVSDIETKYGLKFKTKLMIGYYIFENISGSTDEEVVQLILENEKNIDTVKPNWPKKNIPL